ncbi:hypothetical protein [Tunturiibacter lichenicola]|uniref:hypothetical protein n=1 Tax=Tunturiibacter lichenicola TaxID=2051959 RepID=UPI003D9AD60E
MPSSLWTLIPRGIKKKNNQDVLTLGIYISPFQLETDAVLKQPLDGTNGTILWTQWYMNRQSDLLSGKNPNNAIKLSINGNTDSAIAPLVTFEATHPTQQEQTDWRSTWQKLLCYQQPDWEGQTFSGSLPNSPCPPSKTSSASVGNSSATLIAMNEPMSIGSHGPLAIDYLPAIFTMDGAALQPPPVSNSNNIYLQAANGETKSTTSRLHQLATPVGQVKTTMAVVAALKVYHAAVEAPNIMPMASALQAHAANTLDELVIVKPFEAKPSPEALAFQGWLRTQLASTDPAEQNVGLVAQRNLYRLADDPYHRLNSDVFAIVRQLAEGNGQIDDNDKKTQFIEHAIFHRRCQPPALGKSSFGSAAAPTAGGGPAAHMAACSSPTLQSFYRTLALLARFPEWLERFGFSYTVTVILPPGQILKSVALLGLPQSCGAWPNPASGLTCSTQCTADGYVAYIPPDDDSTTFQYDGNLLLLDPNTCTLVENDVDGESLRLLQHANSLSLSAAAAAKTLSIPDDADPPDAPPTVDSALPARSIGITLLHSDSRDHQDTCLARHASNNTGLRSDPSQPLGLVDLVRGYAPEISFAKDVWYPLTKRQVIYNDEKTACPQPHAPVYLEAAVHNDSPSATGNGGSVSDLHIPQALFRWNGWSLTVPSPFTVNQATCTGQRSAPAFPISAKYIAEKGSLVRLRFGAKYSMRVRLVDLLGEPMEPSVADNTTLALPYLRNDPVPPPILLLEGEIDGTKWPGESLTTLVRRDGQIDHLPRRSLCPPVANLDLLLQHGALDAPPEDIASKNGFLHLDTIGTFEDVFIDPLTGDFPTLPIKYDDGTIDRVPAYKPAVSLPSRTYLPDPMALLVQPEVLDLATGAVYSNFPAEAFYGNEERWPHAHRLRVEMDSSTGHEPALSWRTDEIDKVRTLMVSVPKGWQIKLRLKCVPGRGKAELFVAGHNHEKFGQRLLEDIRASFRDASLPDTETIHKTLGDGGLPQYTPSRELTIIHAVQRPLRASTFGVCDQPSQTYDSPVATFNATATIGDRRSTGKIEFLASWEDLTDGDPTLGATNRLSKAQIAEYNLNSTLFDAKNVSRTSQRFKDIKHSFPDTRCRIITLSANSVSRFGHYYLPAIAKNETQLSMPDPTPQKVTLLSTSRPAAPRVMKIIPLLPVRSIRDRHNHSRTHTRVGGAFRVYLDRSWYSSGFGEMLGLVLWGEDPKIPAPKPNYTCAANFVPAAYQSWDADPLLEPFVTRWGADPTRSASVGTLAPRLKDFVSPPNANGDDTTAPTLVQCAFPAEMLVGQDDVHPEKIDPTHVRYISLAAYPVAFQKRTQLWYADVQIKNLPAYNTFIRLALTRYQPTSLVNRECSSIVIAGFAQLLDGRSLLLQHLGSGMMQVQIYAVPNSATCTQQINIYKLTLEYQDDGKWLPANSQPSPVEASAVLTDDPNPLVATYSFYHQHPLRATRLIIEEYETWFADDPANRGIRTTRMLPRPPDIIHIPHWSLD